MGFQDSSLNISVRFDDPSCIGFLDIMRKTDRHTDKRRYMPYHRDCGRRG